MINLQDYIAPQGTNLRGDIWVMAGPWVGISKQCSIEFPNNTTVIIKMENFSYLTHGGSITFKLSLTSPNFCNFTFDGKIDGKPVSAGAAAVSYSLAGNKLVINWNEHPLSIYRYHGNNETEIDVGNVPVIGNASLWIGK
jgi:hypothetical protein